MKRDYIIGLDEVGRGSLAGPLVVAAVVLPKRFKIDKLNLKKLKASKKTSPKKREEFFSFLKENSYNLGIFFKISKVSPLVIDRINVSKAANLAATRACKNLLKFLQKEKMGNFEIILDGGLSLLDKNFSFRSFIKGDERYLSIKLASIIAKVYRDRYMEKIHSKFPVYFFNQNKGYGTRKHLQALFNYGPSPIHRLTFIKNYFMLNKTKKNLRIKKSKV